MSEQDALKRIRSDIDAAHSTHDRTEQRLAFFTLGLVLFMVVSSYVLTLVNSKRDYSVMDAVIYGFGALAVLISWISMGYLTDRNWVVGGQHQPKLMGEWMGWKSIGFYVLVMFPCFFFYVWWGVVVMNHLGLNFILLFVLSAFSGYCMPLYMTPAGVVSVCLVMAGLDHYAHEPPWFDLEDFFGFGSGMMFSALIFFMLNKERKSRFASGLLAQNLDTANAQLQAYSEQAQELAATSERNRIAREIHDTLGHTLTVVNVQLEAAQALMDSKPEKAKEAMKTAQALTRKGLEDVRHSVSSLRSSSIEGRSLQEGIEGLIGHFQHNGTQINFTEQGEVRPLARPLETAVYRIVQEGLTNIQKHAQAEQVDVELDYRDASRLTVLLKDDGRGCEQAEGGFGLIGIRERVQFLNGDCEIQTSPGQGFSIKLCFPL